MTIITTTEVKETTASTLSAHSALETLLLTTTPQLMKNDRNGDSSEEKAVCVNINKVDANSLEKRTSKSGNEFTVSYANERPGSKMVGATSVELCTNLNVETPSKALFTNRNNKEENDSRLQHEQQQQQQQQQLIENRNVNEDSDNNNNSCNKIVEHASNMTEKLMEEPSALLFLTPTYRNKVYTALQQINDVGINAIDSSSSNLITFFERKKYLTSEENNNHVSNVKNSDESSNESHKIENDHNHSDNFVNGKGDSCGERVNRTKNIHNIIETDACSREREMYTAEEVYNLLKDALAKFELQRDEEEANVLSNLRTEMDELQRKYELLCVERQEMEKEKQELERELNQVVHTMEEVLENKMFHYKDMQQRLLETEHLLGQREKAIRELEHKIQQLERRKKQDLPTSVHNTFGMGKELLLLPEAATSSEASAYTEAANRKDLQSMNANEVTEALSKEESSGVALMENKTESCNDEVTSMAAVNKVISRMNEMHYGMTEMESTLKEQQARIVELEDVLKSKEQECKELEKVNAEITEKINEFRHSGNESAQEWTNQIESLHVTVNAQRKEMQAQTRKLIALQNERSSHINFSRDLESFTQMLLQEQSEIYTKLSKLSSSSVNKIISQLKRLSALLHKKLGVKESLSEELSSVSSAHCHYDDDLETSIVDTLSSSSWTSCIANNKNCVNPINTKYQGKDQIETNSVKDVKLDAISSEDSNISEKDCKSRERLNVSGRLSKAVRLLEVRRRAITRVVQQIERQMLLLMISCDKVQHECCKLSTQQPQPSDIKEKDHDLSAETGKTVIEKQRSTSNKYQMLQNATGCNSNGINKSQSIPESNVSVTSPSPHRPPNSKEVIEHLLETSLTAHHCTYNHVNAIRLRSSSEEYSCNRHGLSASQESSHNDTSRSVVNRSSTFVNNVHVDKINECLPRASVTERLQTGIVLDGGSLCPLPPPRLRVST